MAKLSSKETELKMDNKDLSTWQKPLTILVICTLTLIIVFLSITIIFLVKHGHSSVTVNIVEDDNIRNNGSFKIFNKQKKITATSTPFTTRLIGNLERHQHSSVVTDKNIILNNGTDQNILTEKSTQMDGNLTLSNFKLISRTEWLAQPPVERPMPLALPVKYVVIHHTATENCSTQAQCIFQVRFIQTFHMESRNWWDIGYNFLVGGDGKAYEGRGWTEEGAHTYGYNSKSFGISFIGTFNSIKPPTRQITACKLLIEKGIELGYIKKDYKLLAARQLQTTQSPGATLYEEIKTWDNWSNGP